jgi:hypothetical protein
MAVRANHAVTVGSGRTATAASAVKMIPARAWHRMRTGSGTKGTRHYDWAMLEVTSDDAPGRHADGHSVLLARRHRYTGQLSFYRCWTPEPVPLSRLIAFAVTRWRIEDHQLARQCTGLDAGQVIRWKSWHRWTAMCLLAYIYLAARRRAAPARHQLRPGRRTDPGHHSGAAAAPARQRHPVTPARPAPPAALVGLATPPPAPRPPSPPTLERLRRDNTMITTNYSRRIFAGFAAEVKLRTDGASHGDDAEDACNDRGHDLGTHRRNVLQLAVLVTVAAGRKSQQSRCARRARVVR